MRVLVTGASGFIGSHLAARLTRDGHHVSAAPRDSLRDPDALLARLRPDWLFHLAAAGVLSTDDSFDDAMAVNVLATAALGRAAVKHRVARFVHVGTAFEYGPLDSPIDEMAPLAPRTLYGASKLAGWMILDHLHRSEGLPLVTFRPFMVYGPGERDAKFVPTVVRHALRGKSVDLSPCTQRRDPLYVDDLVDALLLGSTGGLFNLGGDDAVPLTTVVTSIFRLAGAPISLARFGARGHPRHDPASLVANSAHARARLGWRPRVPLDEGLRRTVEWFRDA